MRIDFHDETNSIKEDYVDMIQRLLTFACKEENVTQEAEISISFVDDKEIQEINRNYRQINKPTDVISFALEETGEGEVKVIGEDLPIVLGDIVISVERAKEQATEYNHSFDRELGFLTLHGLLHLLGYDHMNEVDEKRMFQRQEEILHAFGLPRQ
ncbi:rRNA maturation RNase YbeY [Aquibacillus rhizosphaerae]|uniref:Endoribonuclease YbeY n=1 Tax=Aquibacillus rhizosphaerae TaxID=3051431 RepID=A0ABT7LAE1_9BACI|nr:rRNA maturation RNase YbeY [Aquibacillus sp. LR5S19]MDL4841506.1 rRNA maturation RNase YbeY [Aquibacillus sp. LR5S19]